MEKLRGSEHYMAPVLAEKGKMSSAGSAQGILEKLVAKLVVSQRVLEPQLSIMPPIICMALGRSVPCYESQFIPEPN